MIRLNPFIGVEGPSFSGKSTLIHDLANRSDVVGIIEEHCEYAGGNRNFRRVPFESARDAQLNIDDFIELERRRFADAWQLHQRSQLPVVFDRTILSVILLQKYLAERHPDLPNSYAYSVEAIGNALERNEIATPSRMIFMMPRDESTFLDRTGRGTGVGFFRQYETCQYMGAQNQLVNERGFGGNGLYLSSSNGTKNRKRLVDAVIDYITANSVGNNPVRLGDIFPGFESRQLSTGVQARRYQAPDQPSFKAVVLTALAEMGFSYDPILNYDLNHPNEFYSRGRGGAWVIEANGRIVATAAAQDLGNGIANFRRFAVVPELRGHGLGRALEEVVFRSLANLGFGSVRLDTLQQTGVFNHYLELGFRIIGTEPEGKGVKVIMEKHLKNP